VKIIHFFLVMVFFVGPVGADEMRPAALRLQALEDGGTAITWQLPTLGEDRRLPLRLMLNGAPYQESSATGYRQGSYWISRLNMALTMPINVQVSGLNSTNTELLVSLSYLNGERETRRLQNDTDVLEVDWREGASEGAFAYIGLGFEHILIGADHLLFVAALMLLVTRLRLLVLTITSFTVAHSLTLAAASMGWLQLPIPPVEAVIALSIVFVAREIVMRERGHEDISSRYPWVVAFCFGLLHGLGFASVLAEIGLPEGDRVLALLLFNVGVEFGQLVFVALLLLTIAVLKRLVPQALWRPTYASYGIGAIAAFWMIERTFWF
jgi:hydrogenase/urease accessory protein HupE